MSETPSPVPQPRTRYAAIAIALHWVIAAGIIFQILLGWRMEDLKTPLGFALVQLHKSVGITILLLSLVRLGWRLANPPPPEPEGLKTWEVRLSKAVHLGFYVIMIGMPLTGWLLVSASRIEIPTLLFGVVPWPHVPGIADLAEPAKGVWRMIGGRGHGLLAFTSYLLVALHVAGALKHQLFDRETPILDRMAPGARAGNWFDLRLILIALGGLGVIAAAGLVQPRLPASAPLPPAVEDDAVEPPASPVAAPAPESAAVAPTVVEAPPAIARTWVVGKGSSLGFTTSWGGEAIAGRFEKFDADIVFGPDALKDSKVKVAIDLSSAVTGDAQRDQSLPAADWFDAATHPTAIFTASRFEKTGEGRFIAHGKLSLRGVTQPLDLPFRLRIEGDRAHMSGVTTIDRTVFGVGQGEWKATDQIPARVKVSVQLTATAK
ncbi:MAG: cytochrome B [Alphaproteobacteria bacterium PA2]|nr:MAG: cytochrome B [Alphaproteobacteria bacterium PA2]